jgi:serine/threonine-protein kinase
MGGTNLLNAIIGEYRIVGTIGEGGMGEVYRAVHNKIGRVVAVKVLSQATRSPEFVERFLNEACIQASLQHPNIATLYDFLEYNNQPCIIMEFVEGQTLTDYIKMRGALHLAEAFPIFRSIVEALAYVHDRGIIHRDIKSNNIKITPSGQVKLLDFGIAKSGSSPSLTVAGGFVGTLQYVSPEQFTGGIADARSDVWALGVLLYEMVTARLPFDATTIGRLYEQINAAAYTPPSIVVANLPREIEAIIARCLRRNPAERYQTAGQLLQDVCRAMQPPLPAQPVSASYPPPQHHTAPQPVSSGSAHRAMHSASGAQIAPQAPPSGSKMKLLAALAAAAVLLIVVVGGMFVMMSGPAEPPASTNTTAQKPGPQPPTPTRAAPPGPQSQTFTLEVAEGQADVYKNGERVGATPYQFQARPGEQIDVVLKRDGFHDKTVQMSLSENKKVYTFAMEKKQSTTDPR